MADKYMLLVEPDKKARESVMAELAGHFGTGVQATDTIDKAIKKIAKEGGIEAVIGVVSEAKFPPYGAIGYVAQLAEYLKLAGVPLIVYTVAEHDEFKIIGDLMLKRDVTTLSKSEDGVEGLIRTIEEIWRLVPRESSG